MGDSMSDLKTLVHQLTFIMSFVDLIRIKEENLFFLDFTNDSGKTWFKYTEQTWSDELVRVAKELEINHYHRVGDILFDIDSLLRPPEMTIDENLIPDIESEIKDYMENPPNNVGVLKSWPQKPNYLELILNKYGRSLNE